MIGEIFRIVWNYIRKRRTRSLLTIIGILIGISAVVTLIALGQGLTNAVDYQFSKLGSNRITISPAGSTGMPMSKTTAQLTEKDVDTVKKVSGVQFAMGLYVSSKPVSFGNEVKQIPIGGMDVDVETLKYAGQTGLYEIEKGRNFKPGDRYKVVIGSKVATDAFSRTVKVGDMLTINNTQFQVIGIQKSGGTGIMDIIIRMPKDALRELDGKTDEVSMINAIVKEGADIVKTSDRIEEALRNERNEKKGEESFTVQTTRNMINSFLNIIAVIQGLLVGIAGISLLVGAIGIMNTMYTSVLERTSDIGVMKSIGAKNHDILLIFIIEAGLLGLIGGAIGVLLGALTSTLISAVASYYLKADILMISIGPALIFGPLLFSFVIGALSGLFPAVQASKMKPVDSLRYE
jgi:putative ABC transport system permease protein